MTPSDNTNKVMTKRVRPSGASTVILTYLKAEADVLRALAQSIRIKGDKAPSLSLLARRSLRVYADRLQAAQRTRPEIYQAEIAKLEDMVTPVPQPAKKSRKVAP